MRCTVYRILFTLLAAAALFAADDPWAKVKELRSGSDLHVFKKGAAQPIAAKMGDLTDDNLVVVIKNEQIAIPRDQIDRIDYRPPAGKIVTEMKSKTTDPDQRPSPAYGSRVPQTQTTSSVNLVSRPDFETIYRRTPPAPKKAPEPAAQQKQ